MSQEHPKKTLVVHVVQNAAGPDPGQNMAQIERLLAGLPRCDLVALPEVFSLRGSDAELRRGAEALAGPSVSWAAELARRRKAWVLAGSVLERSGGRVYNTSLLLDAAGRIRARDRKLHLFEARLETGQAIRERDLYCAGRAPVMACCMGWRCGMSICYDLRFPELYRRYSARGAFLGCAKYPDCKGIKPMPGEDASDGDGEEMEPVSCPKCGAPMIKKRSRYDDEQKLIAYLARQGFSFDDIKHALDTDNE